MEDTIGCIWLFIWILLTFQFFLNTVLFPHLPLNTEGSSVAQHERISLHLLHSACFSHLSDQKDTTSLSLSVKDFLTLYHLTTITIPPPSYLNLEVLILNNFITWVSTGLQTAFICRSNHLRIKLLKYNTHKCSHFSSPHRMVFDISQVHPRVTGFFIRKDKVF